MKTYWEQFTERIHGYLLVGDRAASKKIVLSISESIRNESIENAKAASFDFCAITDTAVRIDDARSIIRRAYLTAFDGKPKIFFIDAEFITPEAAHALLKVFEEPPRNTYFFIAVSSCDRIPLTLQSRLAKIIVAFDKHAHEHLFNYFSDFHEKLPVKKFEYIKKIASDKTEQERFLNAYEVYFEGLLQDGISNPADFGERNTISDTIKKLEALLAMRHMMMMGASYPKMILEYLTTISLA